MRLLADQARGCSSIRGAQHELRARWADVLAYCRVRSYQSCSSRPLLIWLCTTEAMYSKFLQGTNDQAVSRRFDHFLGHGREVVNFQDPLDLRK